MAQPGIQRTLSECAGGKVALGREPECSFEGDRFAFGASLFLAGLFSAPLRAHPSQHVELMANVRRHDPVRRIGTIGLMRSNARLPLRPRRLWRCFGQAPAPLSRSSSAFDVLLAQSSSPEDLSAAHARLLRVEGARLGSNGIGEAGLRPLEVRIDASIGITFYCCDDHGVESRNSGGPAPPPAPACRKAATASSRRPKCSYSTRLSPQIQADIVKLGQSEDGIRRS